ncbi:MAG: putative toxin-antitoxin system toxin component, PIN family [Lunatimonas sp.]|uniref:putative toxin-antitoxin system toxin component, PIN family n=1 Tax=Lunatimonas sp. TaxID=2060141 RepID=UPI002A463855|nr:putative toxin-antitoxin system toxin component, PIN family [Lunatimonas sp.]
MRKQTSVVLDTNIWVSYIISGNLRELSAQILTYQLQVFACKELSNELEDVLCRQKIKKLLTYPVNDYLRLIQKLTTNFNIHPIFRGAPDPQDNFLFDLALQSKSSLLVTGDKRLFAVSVLSLSILTLSDFKKRFPIHLTK